MVCMYVYTYLDIELLLASLRVISPEFKGVLLLLQRGVDDSHAGDVDGGETRVAVLYGKA